MDDIVHNASVEIVEDETSADVEDEEKPAFGNRLKDFYFNETKCEFKDC